MHFLCHLLFHLLLPPRNAEERAGAERNAVKSEEAESVEEGVRGEEEPHAVPAERAEWRLEARLTIREDGGGTEFQEVKVEQQAEAELRDGISSLLA